MEYALLVALMAVGAAASMGPISEVLAESLGPAQESVQTAAP
jgi:Flp pilus assembly pilin Flp